MNKAGIKGIGYILLLVAICRDVISLNYGLGAQKLNGRIFSFPDQLIEAFNNLVNEIGQSAIQGIRGLKKILHMDLQQKAHRFHALHHNDKLLVLPNIWDPGGALLLEDMQFPAVATASASIAFANGYDDGENIPFEEVLSIVKKITKSVSIPVSADIESGYAEDCRGLAENIARLMETGVVGINLEDTNKKTRQLYSIEEQCERISVVKTVAERAGVDLFINARTDVYLRAASLSKEEKLESILKRGIAYKSAGASGFYPITVKEKTELERIAATVSLPLNVVTIPGIPALGELKEIGVSRVSLGPSFFKIAMQSMKKLAGKLSASDGLEDIFQNDITSEYLRMLVTK